MESVLHFDPVMKN